MTTINTRFSISARTRLAALASVALLAWGGLLLFTYALAPEGVLTFCFFFLLLGIALLCTLTPLIYLITRIVLARRASRPTLGHALRQASLISVWLLLNLLLRVLHSWSLFTAIVSFGIIVVIEFLVIGKK